MSEESMVLLVQLEVQGDPDQTVCRDLGGTRVCQVLVSLDLLVPKGTPV